MQKRPILFLFIIIFFSGCYIDQRCKDNMTCPDSFSSLFRIVSKSSGTDLVFGPASIYDKLKIKIFSVQGGDTTFARYEPFKLAGNNYDSVMLFALNTKPDVLFIQLNNSDVDTISVGYGVTEDRCCSFNSITTLNYNNSGPLKNNNGTLEFKK